MCPGTCRANTKRSVPVSASTCSDFPDRRRWMLNDANYGTAPPSYSVPNFNDVHEVPHLAGVTDPRASQKFPKRTN